MMHTFKSIQFRLTLLVVIAVTIVLAAFGFYDFTNAKKFYENELQAKAVGVSKRLGLALPTQIWNYDTPSILKTMEAELVNTPAIVQIMVINGGKPTAIVTKSVTAALPTMKPPIYQPP
jgi:hypothetical protein